MPSGETNVKHPKRSVALAVAAVVIVCAAVGVAVYLDRGAPLRTTVLVVDGSSVRMGAFLKRVRVSGGEPLSALQRLVGEEIIKLVAPHPPYNISVSARDIDQFLREIARGEGESITESEFKEWYRQQLNESRFSSSEFRDLARTNLLSQRLHLYLAERMPTVAEQVHLLMITLDSQAEAEKAKKRLDSGGDFRALAAELSSDDQLRQKKGDLGWVPRGVLAEALAAAAFDELAVGQVSAPLFLDEKRVVLLMVAEKASARELDEDARLRLRAAALDAWLRQEYERHKIEYRGFGGGYDSKTDAWVKWQLERMKR